VITLGDLRETQSLLTGHFRLSSGLHSDRYLQCARLLMYPDRAERAGKALAQRLREFAPDVVVSPALGGIVIGHETARGLGTPALFAERRDGVFVFRRGFAFEPGARAVVVEDVLTTGKSTRETAEAARAAGARVVAVGAILDRGVPDGAFDVPHRSLLSLPLAAWPEAECPLCAERVPLDTPGSRFPDARR
jgi:orotate phosphoribosyltransferase